MNKNKEYAFVWMRGWLYRRDGTPEINLDHQQLIRNYLEAFKDRLVFECSLSVLEKVLVDYFVARLPDGSYSTGMLFGSMFQEILSGFPLIKSKEALRLLGRILNQVNNHATSSSVDV